MTMTRGNLFQALAKDLDELIKVSSDNEPDAPSQYMTVKSSQLAEEKGVLYQPLGAVLEKPEGSNIKEDKFEIINEFKQKHSTFAKSLGFTKEAIADVEGAGNGAILNQTAKLISVMEKAKHQQATDVLNNATNVANVMTPGGQPLISVAQDGGNGGVNYSNILAVPAALSIAALKEAVTAVHTMRDARGMHQNLKPTRLICGSTLAFTAAELLGSEHLPGGDFNNINSVKTLGVLPKGYMVDSYIDSQTRWFLQTDVQDANEGLIIYNRQDIETRTHIDDKNLNIIVSSDFRRSAGWMNPQAIFMGNA